MTERHQQGIEKAIDRLDQVREELMSHTDEHKEVIVRELEKVERKRLKIIKKAKVCYGLGTS